MHWFSPVAFSHGEVAPASNFNGHRCGPGKTRLMADAGHVPIKTKASAANAFHKCLTFWHGPWCLFCVLAFAVLY